MRKAVLALALDAGLAALLLGPAWVHPASVTVGSRQDAPYTVWAFAWVARALGHGRWPWVTNYLSWPGGVNLLTNATATGLGIVLAPVTRIFGPLVAFNVAATGALAGTAWSAQLVLRRARRASWPAAFVGGVVAGFGPTSLAHTAGGHPHVTAAFLVPPLLLGIARLAGGTARHPVRWGAAVGLLAAAQLLIGEEILAIAAIAAAVGVLVAIRRVRWAPLVTGGAVACGVFVAVAGYPLWIQFAGPAHIRGPIQVGDHYPNDLSAFVVPIRQVWLGSGWSAGLLRRFSSEGARTWARRFWSPAWSRRSGTGAESRCGSWPSPPPFWRSCHWVRTSPWPAIGRGCRSRGASSPISRCWRVSSRCGSASCWTSPWGRCSPWRSTTPPGGGAPRRGRAGPGGWSRVAWWPPCASSPWPPGCRSVAPAGACPRSSAPRLRPCGTGR